MNATKPCPTVPLPAPPAPTIIRRRSSTFNAIANWALAVQPGSPPPISPQYSPTGSPGYTGRRPSLPRRPSLSAARGFSRRRPSIAHSRAPSGSTSFLHVIDTPTSPGHRSIPTPGPLGSAQGFNFDLTNLGYTSVFVHLPHTPSTPSPYLIQADNTKIPVPPIPQTPPPAKGLKKFRSLGMLKSNRNRGKSVAANESATPSTLQHRRSRSRAGSISPSSPTYRVAMASKANGKATPPPSVTTFKKAKKASAAAAPPLPPALASELLLMQFMGGGSLETQAKRVMEKQARDAAPAGASKYTAPVGTVFRDDSGNIWWDEDEALEYQALLPPASPESPRRDWVLFSVPSSKKVHSPSMAVGVVDEERRGSITSSTTLSSSLSLSLNRLVLPAPAECSARAMHLLRLPANELNSDLAAASGAAARNKRTRRRPAPLKLHSSPSVPTTRNVFEDSFVPSPRAAVAPRSQLHRASIGGTSAPAACVEFAAPSKGSQTPHEAVLVSLEGSKTTEPVVKIKPARLGLKGKAKALFGGFS